LRKRDTARLVGIDPDDESIRLLGCEFQESEMTGMNDVKISGTKAMLLLSPQAKRISRE
jgi:hypothetical protein